MAKSMPKVEFADPLEGRRLDPAAVRAWIEGTGPKPALKDDPLRPFRLHFYRTPRRLISLRLDDWLLTLIKEAARQHNMRYQTLMRFLLEDGIAKLWKS